MREISTDDWGIVGSERIPRWPSKVDDRRRVRVIITSWAGFVPGAIHYHLDVEQEGNQWWSEKEHAWVKVYSDHNQDYHLSATVLHEREAVRIARAFVKTIAGSDPAASTYLVTWSGPGAMAKWERFAYKHTGPTDAEVCKAFGFAEEPKGERRKRDGGTAGSRGGRRGEGKGGRGGKARAPGGHRKGTGR